MLSRNIPTGFAQRSRKGNRSRVRRLLVETLEDRRLLNVDWRNPIDSLDVDTNGGIAPLDALLVINYLNLHGRGELPLQKDPAIPFLDVTGDHIVSPLDALVVINHLNLEGSGQRVLKEGAGKLVHETDLSITLGQTNGTRQFRVQIDPQFDNSDRTAPLNDLLAVYLVDPQTPSSTLLDQGANGTSIFTLDGANTEFVPGRVAWDGSILSIDLSDFPDLETGLLRFQLISNDADTGSKITIRPLSNEVDSDGIRTPFKSVELETTALAGTLVLGDLNPFTNGKLLIDHVGFDSSTGLFQAEVALQNQGEAIGRNVALVFEDLPVGVTLRNPSGTTSKGAPYLNLKSAIPMGGLQHGMISDKITIEVEDPSQIQFSLTPKILAGVNHAPTLAVLNAITVSPGGSFNVGLQAADQDNDLIAFSLRMTGDTSKLPTGTVSSSGNLSFSPTPNQIGVYHFDVVASDGAAEAVRSVTLNVVADANTSTRVSGQVLQVDGTPLVNMRVEIGAVQALTRSDGTFTLDLGSGPVVSDTIKVRGDLFAGSAVYPFIAEKIPLLLEHEIYTKSNNVIHRPIYLPALDMTNAKTIDPNKDISVTTDALPGTSLYVAAGTLMNLQGSPFTGKLSITEVPATFTPAALPSNLSPNLVVTIQPGEMVFARPAPLTLTNRSGWAPGTIMDLWSINPVTGQFDDVGDMQVSADGLTVETISGGVRNSSWHFGTPRIHPSPERGKKRNPEPPCNACSLEQAGTSSIESHSGALIETHELPTYESRGETHGVQLVYDSLRADPRPIIHFGTDNVDAFAWFEGFDVGKYAARLTLFNGDFEIVVPGQKQYPGSQGSGLTEGEASTPPPVYFGLPDDQHFWSLPRQRGDIEGAIQADLSDQPTGLYDYVVKAGIYWSRLDGDFMGSSFPVSGQFVSVNSIASPFGAGWGITGFQQIVTGIRNSAALIDGNGKERLFTFNETTGYVSPPGDFSKLERIDGKFRRTLPDQTVYQFDARNQISTITDRNHNVTTYRYDAGGRLTSIEDAAGMSTIFTYTANRVTSITDPAGRTTQLTYDASGNLSRVTNPDSSTRTWDYDALHHMTGETDELGNQETAVYGFHGRVTAAIRKDGTRVQINSPETVGLLKPNATMDFKSAPRMQFSEESIESTYVRPNGSFETSVLDASGQPIRQNDSLGFLPAVQRDANNLPIQSTDSRGFTKSNTFDDKGNLLSTRDSLSVRLGDNPEVIGVALGNIALTEEVDHFSFNARIGERIWFDYVSGSLTTTLTSPSGEQAFDGNLGRPITTLLETGSYHLAITGFPSNYRTILRSVDNARTLASGDSVSKMIQAGEDALFRFHAKRDQRFVLHDVSGVPFPSWSVFGPDLSQTLLTQIPGTSDFELLIPYDAEFILALTQFATSSVDQRKLDFSIELVNPSQNTTSGFGQEFNGTIAQGEEKLIHFSGYQGMQIVLEAIQDAAHPFNATVEVLDPLQRPIAVSQTNRGNYLFSLLTSGEHSVRLRGSNYHFQLIDLKSLPLTTFDSDITSPSSSSLSLFRFSGIQAKRYAVEIEGTSALVSWFSKGHSVSGFGPGIITFPDTEDYYVMVEKLGEPSTVNISTHDISKMPIVPLDEAFGGTFTIQERKKYVRFQATPDSVVYLENLGVSFITSNKILGEGRLLFDALYNRFVNLEVAPTAHSNELTDFVLISKLAEDGDQFLPHRYSFRLDSHVETAGSLTLGQTVNTRIEINETETYTLMGTAGTKVYLDWRTIEPEVGSGFRWELLDPRANVVVSGSDPTTDVGPFRLAETGEYRLKILNRGFESANPRDVQFRIFDFGSAPLASLGSPLKGELVNGESASVFQWNATAGDRLRFDSSNNNSIVRIFSPTGGLIADSGDASSFIVAFSQTGTHTIVVTNRDRTVESAIPFQWQLTSANESSVQATGFDQFHEGNAIEGDILATFRGNAGSRIFLRQIQEFSFTRMGRVHILGTEGETIAKFIDVTDGEFVLPRSGEYKAVWVGLFSPVTVPEHYHIVLTQFAQITKLTPETVVEVPIVPAQFVVPFTIQAVAGQQYLVDLILPDDFSGSPAEAFGPVIEDPNGNQILSNASSSFKATETGTYLVRFPRGSTESLKLSLRLKVFASAPNLLRDIESTGTNSQAFQDVIRQFNVTKGDKFLLQVESSRWLPVNGTGQISSNFWQGREVTPGKFVYEQIITATESGTVYLVRPGDFQLPLAYSVLLSKVVEPTFPLSGGELSQNSYSYDPKFNRLTQMTDEQNQKTLMEIDPTNGNLRTLTQVIGALGGNDDLVTTYTYVASGQIDTITDPLGRVTDYDYDAKGRLVTLTQAKGLPLQTVQHFEYDLAGNLTALVDENGHRTTYEVDIMNRRTRILQADPDDAGPLTAPVTKISYDARGNVKSVTDPLGHVTRTNYDARDRLIEKIDSNNQSTRYLYDSVGNLVQTIDPIGRIEKHVYDARDRLVSQSDSAGFETHMSYDADNNLLSLRDPSGNSTRYQYDARGRTTVVVDPFDHATTFVYDGNDHVVSSTDRLGRTIGFEYDDVGRLIRERWLDAAQSEVNSVAYSYDAAGRLVRIQDRFSDVQTTYDALDRPVSQLSGGVGGVPLSKLDSTFDLVGNVLSMTDTVAGVLGGTINYRYDSLDRLTQLTQAKASGSAATISEKRVDFAYNGLGQYARQTRYSDLAGTHVVAKTDYSYDGKNHVTLISHKNATDAAINSFAYSYDAVDRITQITDIDGATDYRFDVRDQLTTASHADAANVDETYAYDATGNRTSSQIHNSEYVVGDGVAGTADNNRLTSDGTYRYEYDANGSLIKRTNLGDGSVRELEWDHRNRLVRVVERPSASASPSSETSFVYDALNRRIAMKTDSTPADQLDGVAMYFVYSLDEVMLDLVDVDGSGPKPAVESMRYLHGPIVDEILAQEDSNDHVDWFLNDAMETIHDFVDSTGSVVNHRKYDSFGRIISQTSLSHSSRFGDTGREVDAATGLQYNRARYYDTSIGRFISEDPIGFQGGDLNLYRYVNNSPVNGRDPSGNREFTDQEIAVNRLVQEVYGVDTIGTYTKATERVLLGNRLDRSDDDELERINKQIFDDASEKIIKPRPCTEYRKANLDKIIAKTAERDAKKKELDGLLSSPRLRFRYYMFNVTDRNLPRLDKEIAKLNKEIDFLADKGYLEALGKDRRNQADHKCGCQ